MLRRVYVYMFRRVFTEHVYVKKSVHCTMYRYMLSRVYVYLFRRVNTVHVYVKKSVHCKCQC